MDMDKYMCIMYMCLMYMYICMYMNIGAYVHMHRYNICNICICIISVNWKIHVQSNLSKSIGHGIDFKWSFGEVVCLRS